MHRSFDFGPKIILSVKDGLASSLYGTGGPCRSTGTGFFRPLTRSTAARLIRSAGLDRRKNLDQSRNQPGCGAQSLPH